MIKENFIKLYENSFHENWDLPCYTDYGDNISYTYGQVAEEIARLHLLFKHCSLRRGDKIAVIGKNNARWCIAYMATITYGAIIVPILQDFNPSEPLFVVIDKLAVPLFCDRFQRRGRSGAVVAFGDIDTERRAAELIGLELYLSPGPDEEDDEGDGLIYLEDLVGYTVRLTGENPDTPVSNPPPPSSSPESKPASEPGLKHSETGSDEQRSGCSADRIEEFIDGENPLFRVRIGSREVLIPAVEEFIADIDQEQQSIEFDLPEGLLELYS